MILTAVDSRFRILKEKFGEQLLVKLIDSSTNEYVSILPETGGMLFSMSLTFDNAEYPILDCYESEEDLLANLSNSYKGSNLFPFPNRVDEGKYSFDGQPHQLEVNFPNENNAIHGLVYNQPFEISNYKQEDNFCSIELKYSSDSELTGYPFRFEYVISYTLEYKKGLIIETSVTNLENSQNIPVGFGFHPYFKLNNKVDNLQLKFPSIEAYDVNERGLPNGNTREFKEFNNGKLISGFEFDTCFNLRADVNIAETNIYSPALEVGYSVWQEMGENGLNYLQIYIPPHRESIAIEPMTCIANAFTNKIGLIELTPGSTSKVVWGISKL